jgi:hypothetical protein
MTVGGGGILSVSGVRMESLEGTDRICYVRRVRTVIALDVGSIFVVSGYIFFLWIEVWGGGV